MLDIVGHSVRLCDGISRRGFLRIGSLGVAGLTLPEVLKTRQTQAAENHKGTAVILFYQAGGASHIDMHDMKPLMPAEVRGPFEPIATKLPGYDVCELMRSEEHTSELQSPCNLVCRLLLEKKK